MSAINTLFLLPQLDRGGSENLVFNLGKMMDHGRFCPSLAVFGFPQCEEFIEDFEKNRIKVFKIPKTASIDFGLMRKLSRIVADRKVQVINAHHFVSMVYAFYGTKRNKQAGLIYTEHSRWEIERIPLKWRIAGSYLLHQVDGIIAVSAEVAEAIERKFLVNKAKITIIRNGVDLDRFSRQYNREELRREFGLKPNDLVIGMVANFRKIKNHIFLLRAFKPLINENAGVKLMFVGKGMKDDPESSEGEIRGFVRDHSMSENVMFMGSRADIPELLAVMDVFCLISLNEGLPISLIEAMAAGLPVIGSDVDGIRGIVKQGVNGILVGPSDEASLREALRSLLLNEKMRATFGHHSREIADKLYSLERCVRQYQDLFLRVSNKKRGCAQENYA